MTQAPLAPHDEQRPLKAIRGLALLAALTLSLTVQVPAFAETPQPSPMPSQATGFASAADSDGDGTADAPDISSAAAAAQGSGSRVEDLSQRTQQTRVIVNPDLTFEQESYAAPVWVKDAQGRWVDVDYSLVTLPGGGFAPKASPASVVIDGGGAREFARMDLQGGGSTIWSWPVALPTPSVSGPTATYGVGEGVDLLVTATASGVSTRIRINSRDAVVPPDFTVQVRTDGVDLDQGSGGALLFDDQGVIAAQSTRLTAWDARLDAFGDPVDVVEVDSTLVETASNADVTVQDLTLSTPEELVSDPNVEYPITIDPDVALVPSQDTWVREGTTAVYNEYRLMTGRLGDSSNSNPTISYIAWPNSPATATNHMSGRSISQATLTLYQYAAGSCADRQMNIHPLAGAFDESKTVYSTKPSANTTSGTSTTLMTNVGGQGCSAANNFVTANVTSMVQAWAAGTLPNFGMQLNVLSSHANDTSYERRFCSSEPDINHTSCTTVDRIPKLTFTYSYAPPQQPQLPGVSPLKSSGVTWSPTPTLSATMRLAAGDVCAPVLCLKGEFTVKTAAGALVATLVSPAAVVDGGTVSVTVPTLQNSTSYTVTVRASATDVNGALTFSAYSDPMSFRTDLLPGVASGLKLTNDGVAATGTPLVVTVMRPGLAATLANESVCPGENPYCLQATFEIRSGSQIVSTVTADLRRPGEQATATPSQDVMNGSYTTVVRVKNTVTQQTSGDVSVAFTKMVMPAVPILQQTPGVTQSADGQSLIVKVTNPASWVKYASKTRFTSIDTAIDSYDITAAGLVADSDGTLRIPWDSSVGEGTVAVYIEAVDASVSPSLHSGYSTADISCTVY